MDSLRELLIKVYDAQLEPKLFLGRLIVYKLRQSGLELQDKELDQLTRQVEAQFDEISSGEFHFTIDLGDEHLEKRISEILASNRPTKQDVEALTNIIMESIHPVSDEVITVASKIILRAWKKEAQQVLADDKAYFDSYRSRLWARWGNPLSKLEMLISLCNDNGSKFFQSHSESAIQNNDKVFEALTLLAAHGCRIARGIFVLLREGLTDDAQARWRTLHEIMVIAHFIKLHGHDAAERYLLHVGIENFKSAKVWNTHTTGLNRVPVPPDQLKELQETRDRLVARFGVTYDSDYGWASKALNNPKPNFTDIQGAVKFDHFNPFVKIAHKSVHASSTGIAHKSTYPNDPFQAHSTSGISEPGQQTAVTLALLVSALLMTDATMDNVAIMNALLALRNQVYRAFDKASMTFTYKARTKR